ncbi:MAG: alpha/beta hydrolase [Deltaproteobacteria bacterium]
MRLLLLVALSACAAPLRTPRDAGSLEAGDASVDGGAADAGLDGGGLDAGPLDGGAAATILVHYDTGAGHAIAIRGSGGPLSWAQGLPATWSAGNVWTLSLGLTGPVELKPLFDDQSWAVGPNWTLAPGQTLEIWPFFFHQNGSVAIWPSFSSQLLGDSRDIWVYTPPSYGENAVERYPVVYMHDGQNLFTDQYSLSGVGWNVQGAMDDGALSGGVREAIVIGIDNDANRLWEYTPTPGGMDGGGASQYLAFVTTELKPAVDAALRTLPDRANSYVVGSSLGGLLSCYAGLIAPETFGSLGALSPSTWWDNDWIVGQLQASRGAATEPLRVYVDSGDAGVDDDDSADTALLAAAYQSLGVDLDYLVQPDGQHSEVYWRERIPGALAFLLGPRPDLAAPTP